MESPETDTDLPEYRPPHYERDRKIWSLKCRGVREMDIAAEFGISQSRVAQIVARMRATLPLADRAMKRHELSERLDEMRAAAAKIVDRPLPPATSNGIVIIDPRDGSVVEDVTGRLTALTTEARLIERQSKLLGLDAPAQVESAQQITYTIKGADPEAI